MNSALAVLGSLALSSAVAPRTHGPDERAAVESCNAFGIDLYRALAAGQPENLFLSPYSMGVALTMAAEGARQETEAEMAKVLHFPPPREGARSVADVGSGSPASQSVPLSNSFSSFNRSGDSL